MFPDSNGGLQLAEKLCCTSPYAFVMYLVGYDLALRVYYKAYPG